MPDPDPRTTDSALAALLGWTPCPSAGADPVGYPPGRAGTQPPAALPRYSADLNAVALAEAEVCRRELYRQYVGALWEAMGTGPGAGEVAYANLPMVAVVVMAPAEARARACVAVLREAPAVRP